MFSGEGGRRSAAGGYAGPIPPYTHTQLAPRIARASTTREPPLQRQVPPRLARARAHCPFCLLCLTMPQLLVQAAGWAGNPVCMKQLLDLRLFSFPFVCCSGIKMGCLPVAVRLTLFLSTRVHARSRISGMVCRIQLHWSCFCVLLEVCPH